MAFLVSPGVEVKEIDLTNIVPAVSTSIGGYAGHFDWGPVDDIVNLGSEKELARYFGIPSNENAESYFTAATFLRYGSTLLVSRSIGEDALNASSGKLQGGVVSLIGTLAPALIRNINDYEQSFAEGSLEANFYARCPGSYGNSLRVMIQPADRQGRYNITELQIVASDFDTPDVYTTSSRKAIRITVIDESSELEEGARVSFKAIRSSEDWINDLENSADDFYLDRKEVDTYGNITYVVCSAFDVGLGTGTVYDPDSVYPAGYLGEVTPLPGDPGSIVLVPELSRGFIFSPPETQDFESAFVTKPGTSQYAAEHGAENDEIHVLVVDVDGVFSESPGSIIERFANLSVASDAKREDGSSVYYKDVINTSSKYIIADNLEGIIDAAGDAIVDLTNGGTFDFTSSFDVGSIYQAQLQGGQNGTWSNGNTYRALELFSDAETLDVNLIFAENDSEANITVANRLIRLAEARKDCVAFISPDMEVKDQSTEDAKLDKVLSKFDRLPSTSYAVFDSGPLYVYNKYADEYIWVPASGSIAGLCARTDNLRDPWWSPAGYNRGQLLGVAKLAYNPLQNHRDELYKARINPIVAFPGEGIILFGDKTAQAKPSAFDRINVRRLFIVLEKAIATAAKYSLFEFNDEFTRAQFRNLVEPYLRDIQGRRGITDFLVVCDETNNTGEVIDSNRFVADIYIKPARAINFITLNFIATRTGVEFSEVVGKF